jgi:hypothetical protein
MKRMQESKMVPPIFIGRWTPKVLFSLKERPYRHGSCVATLESSPSISLLELSAILNPLD